MKLHFPAKKLIERVDEELDKCRKAYPDQQFIYRDWALEIGETYVRLCITYEGNETTEYLYVYLKKKIGTEESKQT